jgi:tetratricopeptide (TPR) repeat protein
MMTFGALLLTLLLSQEPIAAVRAQFDAGNYKTALNTLSTALRKSPDDASLHYWIARTNYELRNYDEAINHAELSVRLAPQNAEFSRWLGRAYGAKAEQSHSFFLARKVKQAFELAVKLAPGNIAARRDLMQYCVEAPWIAGGDKDKAKQQIAAIAALDAVEGRLARAAYLKTEKQWKPAETEYLAVLEQHPRGIDPYMEAAEFFSDRKDTGHLEKTVEGASRVDSGDPRISYYRAVALILKGTDGQAAEQLLKTYIASVPEKSEYPSHKSAADWLARLTH